MTGTRALPVRALQVRAEQVRALQVRAEQLAARLPPLLLAAERVAATVSQGMHGRRRTGPGDSFWQFRRYQPGDPVQAIDWRQTAKRERVYIRQTEWEAAQTLWLWRDPSASMRFRSHLAPVEKGERADLLLLALASLLLRAGERLMLIGGQGGGGQGRLRLGGPDALRRAAHALFDAHLASEADGDAPGGVPPVEPMPRDAQLVLIGDFLDPLERVAACVRGYAGFGVSGHLVQITDPAEHALPYAGRTLFEGMEREGEVLARRTEALRPRYAERLARHQDGLAALARAAGWSLTLHTTDRPPETALLALYAALSPARAG